ncbi:MAG: serine/threonine-protein kinase [Planctomycetota bacterium]
MAEGHRVAEWVLDRMLGHGTFGDVWLAHHHIWADQQAAVKLPRDPAYVRALRREGVNAHRLDHPNIVKALGIDPYAEQPYLIMEYVPGTTLRDVMKDGRLSVADATSVLQQVLSALGHAHERGIVHRDVKPENVLIHEAALAGGASGGLSMPGLVKLTDFGLGQAELQARDAATNSIVFSTDAQQSPSLAGSLDYIAPEVKAGKLADGRADLYACGVMLFEMLVGERPAGTDVPSDVRGDVPAWVDDAFRQSYARLDRRFADAAAFAAALGERAAPTDRAVPVETKQGEWTIRNVDAERRRSLGDGHACGACGARVDADDQFCMSCGRQLVDNVRRCGRCGSFPARDDAYCMFCGSSLSPAG